MTVTGHAQAPETTRPGHTLVASAAAPLRSTVRAVRNDQLNAPTPCTEFDVRRLLQHLLFWGPLLEAAATDAPAAPVAETEERVEAAGGDWPGAVEAQIDRTVAAWSDPAAWEGTTRLGGPDPMPSPLIGGMVLTELVVHGWDLARATGRQPQWDAEVAEFVHREVERTAEQGREMGVYGPPVSVPANAPVLDRALGLTGRDPGWAP